MLRWTRKHNSDKLNGPWSGTLIICKRSVILKKQAYVL